MSGFNAQQVINSIPQEKRQFKNLNPQLQENMANVQEMAQKQRALRTDMETKEDSFDKQMKENTDKSKTLARLLNTVEYNIKKEADKLETVKADVTLSKKFSDQALGNWRKISNSRPLDKNYTSVYFQTLVEKLEKQMQELWVQIEDVGNILSKTEDTKMSSAAMLQESLKAQQESFLTVASNVAALHEQAEEYRDMFKKMFLSKNEPDPFIEQKPSMKAQVAYQFGTMLPGMQPGYGMMPAQQQQQQQQQQQGTQFSFNTGTNNFSFSTATNTTTNFSFNMPTTSSTNFNYAAAPTSQFSFNMPATTNFSFSTAPTQQQAGGTNFSFGTTTATTNFSFSTAPAQAFTFDIAPAGGQMPAYPMQ